MRQIPQGRVERVLLDVGEHIDSMQNVTIPQNGIGTVLSGPSAGLTGLITGFVQISPAEINLKHQLALMGTIGRAFGSVALYAGGGPALFGVETNFINGIRFAVTTAPISATFPASVPTSAFNNNWVWGGAAQVGTMYAFARGWFLDVNYTYARSANFTIENSLIAHNQIGPLTLIGPAVLNTQERITNQSVTLTINYQFH